jgi:antitoxin HicB
MYRMRYTLPLDEHVVDCQKRLPPRFYRNERGKEPVRDWLLALEQEGDRKAIGADIKTVEFGWPIGMPTCRSLGGSMNKPGIGNSFDSFLEEAGIRDEVERIAQKRVLAWLLQQEMDRQGVTKSEMARRMDTSRSQVDRLLDPKNDRVQLDTLVKAAHAIGRELKLELV